MPTPDVKAQYDKQFSTYRFHIRSIITFSKFQIHQLFVTILKTIKYIQSISGARTVIRRYVIGISEKKFIPDTNLVFIIRSVIKAYNEPNSCHIRSKSSDVRLIPGRTRELHMDHLCGSRRNRCWQISNKKNIAIFSMTFDENIHSWCRDKLQHLITGERLFLRLFPSCTSSNS